MARAAAGASGVSRVINGPIPYTPDGHLIGPMPGVPNAFEAAVFTFGIAQAGGAGKVYPNGLPMAVRSGTSPIPAALPCRSRLLQPERHGGHGHERHAPITNARRRDKRLSPNDAKVRMGGVAASVAQERQVVCADGDDN